MTNEAYESRLDRIEALVERNSQQISALTGRAGDVDRGLVGTVEVIGLIAGQLNRVAEKIDALTERFDRLTERVDSLAASAEQHDRILDYLLRRDGGVLE